LARHPALGDVRDVESKPVRPLLEVLPLDQLTFKQFQSFSALLLRVMYTDAIANEFGVEGDTQYGIDLEIRFPDGRVETVQCKREKKFGPKKIRKAINQHKVKCDRALIFLSRPATAAARAEMRKSRKWELWDSLDISRHIRTLPP